MVERPRPSLVETVIAHTYGRRVPSSVSWRAFADESFVEAATGGFYVLAAVVFEHGTHQAVREAMLGLRGTRGSHKLHWNEMDSKQKRTAAKVVADLDGFHIVAIGSPVPARRQERARAACLTRLVHELHGYAVSELWMEARTDVLNMRDIDTVRGARYGLPKGAVLRVEHIDGKDEPVFWAADIVAGAIRTHREGRAEYRALLADCVYEIDVATDC